jgi:hypothetical protein
MNCNVLATHFDGNLNSLMHCSSGAAESRLGQGSATETQSHWKVLATLQQEGEMNAAVR